MSKKIGFIGIGLMGLPMAKNILKSGFNLKAFNRSQNKTEPLKEFGAEITTSIDEVVKDSDVVITMLTDDLAINDVMDSPNFLENLKSGATVIDMSSVKPTTATKHGDNFKSKNINYLDAPVSGGTIGAEDGSLAIMVGGEQNVFDNVIDSSGVYHLMTHPNILQWDEDFTWSHLDYISNRKDIWYVGFGHLYLYRYLSNSVNDNSLGILENKMPLTSDFKLYQNYPNPFNPITSLQYDLTKDGVVNITIYDMMGRLVKTLVYGSQTAGFKTVQWDATNDRNEPISAGLYLYTMQKGQHRETGKMVLIK